MQTTKATVLRACLRATLSLFLMAAIMTALGLAVPVTSHRLIDESELQPVSQFRIDMKTFMKLSKDEDRQLQQNAVFNLCTLHDQIVRDVRFLENRQLQGYRATIAKRLEGYKNDFAKQEAKALRESKRSDDALQTSANANEFSNEQPADQFTSAERGDQEQGLASSSDGYMAGAESYYSMGQLSGGPNQMFNYVGGRLGAPWDNGQELVELIENTINPSTWQSNGGPNTIHYFKPLRVLVVGATFKTQDDTLDLLMKLKRAQGDQIQVGGGINNN